VNTERNSLSKQRVIWKPLFFVPFVVVMAVALLIVHRYFVAYPIQLARAEFFESSEGLRMMGMDMQDMGSCTSFFQVREYTIQQYAEYRGHPVEGDCQNVVTMPPYFPSGRQYKVVLTLPEGMDAAEVPFAWDQEPCPGSEWMAILFWDGSTSPGFPSRLSRSHGKELTEQDLNMLLANIAKKNNGRLLEIREGKHQCDHPKSE
jgi:hypothetical protein